MHVALVSNIEALPKASDPRAAARGLEDWQEGVVRLEGDCRTAAVAIANDEDGIRILTALFGNSSFLGDCALARRRGQALVAPSPPTCRVADRGR